MGFGGTGGGSGSIASSSDVSLNVVTNNDVLTYDASVAKWKNAVGGSGGGSVASVAGKTGVVTLVKADVGLDTVDNTSDAAKPVSTATQTALSAKAPLASPVFTGTPTAPTATAGGNNTQLATTAFVTAAIATALSSSGASPVYVIYYDTASATWKGHGGAAVPATAPAGVLIRLVDKRGADVADYSGAQWTGVSDWMPITAA